MKSWKVLLGLGAACAACCAIPLLGVAGALASFGTALAACADELLPLAGLLLLAATGLFLTWWWRRRQAARLSAACACPTSCSADGPRACS